MNVRAPTYAAAPRWQVWVGLGIVYVVWGSTYLAIRIMVRTVPPLLGAGVRFALAGSVLLAWLRWRRGRAVVSRRQLAAAALIGTLLAAGGNGLVTVAERHVPSGLAALLIASVPLWVVLLRALLREHPARGTLVGVAFGFVGVALLLMPGGTPHGVHLGGVVLLLCAALSWATGTVASPRLELPAEPLRSTGLQMLFGGAVMTVAGLADGELVRVHWGGLSAESLGAFAYLVLVGSLVAFTAYVWLLQHAPVSQVATYAYVNPVIAVFLGWMVLGESITAATLAGAAVIVASVAFIVGREARVEPEAPPGAEPGPETPELERAAA